VEHVQVTGVQQQALGGNQGFTCNLEGRRLGRIARVRRAGIKLLSQEFFISWFYIFAIDAVQTISSPFKNLE
jgi:hypothetical protein